MRDVISELKAYNNIAITYHTSPDGDALGSALALLRALKKIGKKVYIVSKDKISDTFSYLNFSSDITGDVCNVKDGTECLVTLDCGNVERLSGEFDFENRTYKVINIDHHLSNDKFGDINYVDINAAATAEIVYDIIKELKIDIDIEIAKCIYTSLLTDTGGYRHSNTTEKTHNIAGELISLGLDFSSIHRNIFENKPFKRLKLYGKVFDSMKLYFHDKICIMKISEDMLRELDMEPSDTSDVVSYGVQIDSVEVAVLLKESDDGIKVSLRAKNYADVRSIAEQFGGGGHVKASGCKFKDVTLKEAEDKILKAIENGMRKWME